MSSSLTEMVVAISILGLVMTGLVVTTAKTIITYQAADAQVEASTGHAMATVRGERIVGRTWRDADPPAGHGDLTQAKATEIRVGQWRLRTSSNVLEQLREGSPYKPLAQDVSGFEFSYRVGGGAWISQTLNADQRAALVAVKSRWSDAATGRVFGGITVLPDRQFATGAIVLPSPDTSGTYSRSNHERQMTLSLGSWP